MDGPHIPPARQKFATQLFSTASAMATTVTAHFLEKCTLPAILLIASTAPNRFATAFAAAQIWICGAMQGRSLKLQRLSGPFPAICKYLALIGLSFSPVRVGTHLASHAMGWIPTNKRHSNSTPRTAMERFGACALTGEQECLVWFSLSSWSRCN